MAASILGSIAADLRGDAAAVISSRDAVAASLDARAAVLEAAAELGDEIVRDFGGAGGWPAHVPTRDEVPLVRLAPISGVACAEELERTLADAVRASGFLHLVDPAGADAALELRGGVDLTGRFTVDLFDVVAGRVLVRARSRRFATLPAPTAPSAPAAAQEPAVLPPPDAPEPSPPAGRPPRRTS